MILYRYPWGRQLEYKTVRKIGGLFLLLSGGAGVQDIFNLSVSKVPLFKRDNRGCQVRYRRIRILPGVPENIKMGVVQYGLSPFYFLSL
jgi:hypothetical protein